jgi:F0F1-type ATP synthase assembly protein I
LSGIVLVVTEVIMRAWQPAAAVKARVGPLTSLAVALAFAVVAAFLQNADVYQAVLTAVVAGAAASGIYDVITGVVAPPSV